MSERSIIFEPQLIDGFGIQVSAHACNKHVIREIQFIFPNVDLNNLTAVVTMQHSNYDLVNWGTEIDKEKDDLLENVCCFSVIKICFCFFNFDM